MADDDKPKKKPKIPPPRRGAGMFRCDKCGRQFRTKAGLVNHVFKKHPIPPE